MMDYGEEEAQFCHYPIQLIDTGKFHALPTPLARITTCGLLQIEVLTEVVSQDPPVGRYKVLPSHSLRGRGAVPSLMLLKLLASSPHRFATNDWLMTQMYQEMPRGAEVRLDTPASYLRNHLCQLNTEPSVHDALRLALVAYLRNGRGSGPGYQVASYPLLWLDIDALSSHVERGLLMENMGEPGMALSFWQKAYSLASQGAYLADEPHSDWALAKREQVEGQLRQSVHALRRLLLAQRGQAGKEEVIALLRGYWLSHKTDEDALRPLMELLGEQERFGEAEQYYQQCVAALEEGESGRVPAQQTWEVHEFLRTKHLRREQHPASISSNDGHGASQTTPSIQPTNTPMPSSDLKQLDIPPFCGITPENGEHFSCTIPLQELSCASLLRSLTQEQVMLLHSLLAMGDTVMKLFDSSRRTALQQLATALGCVVSGPGWSKNPELWEKLSASQSQSRMDVGSEPWGTALAPKTTEQKAPLETSELLCFADLVRTCWSLSSAQLQSVEQLLPVFLPSVQRTAIYPSDQQRLAAHIACQAEQLASIVALHHDDFSSMEAHRQQAVFFGHLSGDINLYVTALMRLATTYAYLLRPRKAYDTYQQILSHLPLVTPLIRARSYIGLAEAAAHCGETQQALTYRAKAHEAFPEHPDKDEAALYADGGHFTLALWESMTYMELGQPEEAVAVLQLVQQKPALLFPLRVQAELINHQAQAEIAMRHLDESTLLVEEGVKQARKLGSQRRYKEAYDNYQMMRLLWRHERRVKDLEVLFRS